MPDIHKIAKTFNESLNIDGGFQANANAYATDTLPGLVSTLAQTFGGRKKFPAGIGEKSTVLIDSANPSAPIYTLSTGELVLVSGLYWSGASTSSAVLALCRYRGDNSTLYVTHIFTSYVTVGVVNTNQIRLVTSSVSATNMLYSVLTFGA